MKVLVTGCAGFVGNNLVKRLKALNHEVVGLDNYSTGTETDAIEADENNLEGFDCIFHLGMPSSSPLYKEKPTKMCEEMVGISMEMLELARECECPIVYASSSSIYNGHEPPHREEMVEGQKDYYTIMRAWLENMSRFYFKKFGVPSVGLRIFSCYGPGDVNKGKIANVVTQFAVDMINGRRPLVYGNGEQSRDFVHVYDVVEAFIKSWEFLIENPTCEIINVGSGVDFSFNEAIEMINEVQMTKTVPKYTPNQIHNYVFTTRADTTKMEKFLGFKAKPLTDLFPEYVKGLRGKV